MGFTVYDGIYAYAKEAVSGLYLNCKTSIFNNPKYQIYTPKGMATQVRQFDAGKAGTYSKTHGWQQSYGGGRGVEWKSYAAPFDRAKVLRVDIMDELQSYANGMTPSIDLLNWDFFNNQMPAEIDAANIATFYNRVPDANKHGSDETNYATDQDSILNTILNLENDIYNSGYDGKSVLFMRSKVYTAFQKAVINKYGLASGAMLNKKTMTVNIDSELGALITDNDGMLSVDVAIYEFGRFYIMEMPDDRMYNLITMLDGTSTGQEDGGYVPDESDEDFALIDLLAVPYVAAFVNTRHVINNFIVPAALIDSNKAQLELAGLNGKMFGNIEIGSAGINQKGSDFEYDIRIIYGGDIFDNRKRNCFVVQHSGSEPTPTPKYETLTVNCNSTVAAGGSIPVTLTGDGAAVTIDDNVTFTTVAGTGTGNVSVSKGAATFTGGTAGTVTIVAAAGGAIGTKEVTVTSE